jgi:hypothetical protein
VEDIIQSALGIDDGDSITIDVPRLSFDDSSEGSLRRSAEVGEIGGDVGIDVDVDVDVDLGDVGLRHRSAECISGSHSSRHEMSSKEG